MAQLLLLPLALGDLHAGDEEVRLPVLVEERRGRPRDDRFSAPRGAPAVFVLARRALGGQRSELPADVLGLARDDEDLPELLLLKARLVRDPGHLLERLVDADDAAVRVDHAEEARRVVDDGTDEVAFALELRGQALQLREFTGNEDRLVAVLHDPRLEVA